MIPREPRLSRTEGKPPRGEFISESSARRSRSSLKIRAPSRPFLTAVARSRRRLSGWSSRRDFCFENRDARGEWAGVDIETFQFPEKSVNPKQRLIFCRGGLLRNPFFEADARFARTQTVGEVALCRVLRCRPSTKSPCIALCPPRPCKCTIGRHEPRQHRCNELRWFKLLTGFLRKDFGVS